MLNNNVFKTSEVELNFISGRTLREIVVALFDKLPDGAQNITVYMRYPTWVRMAPVGITVNGILYPVVVIRKDILKSEIVGAEVWVECNQVAPKLVTYV